MMKGIAAELIETHREELLRFLYRRVNCRETALDIVQDCFMRLAGYMESNKLDNPRAFLFRIAANQATDHLRRQSRVVGRAIDVAEIADLSDPTPAPDEIASAIERIDKLKQALSELPPNRREVFILRNIQQRSYAEITEQTGLSYNTIFKYINEALLHCQKRLQD